MKKDEKVMNIVNGLKKLFPKAEIMLRYGNDWELLVAVELSAQCTDKKVNEITFALFKKYPILADYLKAKPKEFEKDIYQSGFYKNKTKNILAAAKVVSEKFDGKLPRTMNEMLSIPGVARKTANVLLGVIYNVVDGIVVDTHVKRLSRHFRLTEENSPEKIEKDLMKILPKEEWKDFSYRMILYGRNYCTARTKDHTECPLSIYEKY